MWQIATSSILMLVLSTWWSTGWNQEFSLSLLVYFHDIRSLQTQVFMLSSRRGDICGWWDTDRLFYHLYGLQCLPESSNFALQVLRRGKIVLVHLALIPFGWNFLTIAAVRSFVQGEERDIDAMTGPMMCETIRCEEAGYLLRGIPPPWNPSLLRCLRRWGWRS
jgi:hypothetical protein